MKTIGQKAVFVGGTGGDRTLDQRIKRSHNQNVASGGLVRVSHPDFDSYSFYIGPDWVAFPRLGGWVLQQRAAPDFKGAL